MSPFWYMERGPPHLPNDGMTMKPSPMATNQIAADAQSFIMQKQHSDGVESSKPKKKKRKMPSENGDTLAPVGTGGKGCSRRPARIRTSFTNEQIQELEAHFLRCMYPRSTEIQRISSQLQLTENIVQVCPWLGVCFTTYTCCTCACCVCIDCAFSFVFHHIPLIIREVCTECTVTA